MAGDKIDPIQPEGGVAELEPENLEAKEMGDISELKSSDVIDKSSLRVYTKEALPEDRQKLAEELRKSRSEIFSERALIRHEIENLREQLKKDQSNQESVFQDIQNLEDRMALSNESVYGQVLSYLGLKYLQQSKLEKKKLELQDCQEKAQELLQRQAELEDQLRDESALNSLRSQIDNFYVEHKDAYRAYQEQQRNEERTRGVESLMKEHEGFFVHGILNSWSPEANSLVDGGASFEAKLKLAIALEPTLSTSFIKKDDGPDRMWAQQGVIVTNGRVESAAYSDAATKAQSITKRTSDRSQKNITGIQQVLAESGPQYNEIVVAKPQIVGMYYTSWQSRAGKDMVKEDFFRLAKEMNLPVFCISYGKVFLVHGGGQPDEEVGPGALAGNSVSFSKEDRERLFEEAFSKEMPFRVESFIPEARYLTSRVKGMEEYFDLCGGEIAKEKSAPIANPEALGLDPVQKKYDGTQLFEGKDVRLLDEITYPSGKAVRYLGIDGEVYEQENKDAPETFNDRVVPRAKIDSHYIRINTLDLGISNPYVSNIDDYLRVMEEAINTQQQNLNPSNTNPNSMPLNILNILSFNLYGFGEAAAKFGDFKTQQRAFAIAEKVRTLENYRDVV